MDYRIIVGIDQSKLTIDAALLQVSKPAQLITEQFENNGKGFKKMIKWILTQSSCPMAEVLICTEHTGLYSYPLCVFCKEHQIALWMESALQIKKSLGVQRGKNDQVDAKRIAQYAFIHRHEVKLFELPAESLLALKQLLAYRERLIESRKSFQTPMKELKEFNADLSGMIVKETNSLVKTIDRKIEKVNQEMMQLVKEDEILNKQYQLITSVPGIGDITAIYLLVYTGGFSRFSNWKQFACFCGIAPFDYKSGTSIKGKTRVSHLANKKLKSILTMCVLGMIKTDNELKQYYDRRKAEGKHSMSIINVLRNKLVSRVFAVVRRGTAYIPVAAYHQEALGELPGIVYG
jgi:transposase